MAWDGTRSGRPEESLVACLQQHSLAATVQGAMQTTATRIKTRALAQTGTRWGSVTRKGPGSGDGWCWRIGSGLPVVQMRTTAMNELLAISQSTIAARGAVPSFPATLARLRHIYDFAAALRPLSAARHPPRPFAAIDVYAPSPWSLPSNECPSSSP